MFADTLTINSWEEQIPILINLFSSSFKIRKSLTNYQFCNLLTFLNNLWRRTQTKNTQGDRLNMYWSCKESIYFPCDIMPTEEHWLTIRDRHIVSRKEKLWLHLFLISLFSVIETFYYLKLKSVMRKITKWKTAFVYCHLLVAR